MWVSVDQRSAVTNVFTQGILHNDCKLESLARTILQLKCATHSCGIKWYEYMPIRIITGIDIHIHIHIQVVHFAQNNFALFKPEKSFKQGKIGTHLPHILCSPLHYHLLKYTTCYDNNKIQFEWKDPFSCQDLEWHTSTGKAYLFLSSWGNLSL